MPKITRWVYECSRCGHQWLPRQRKSGEAPPVPRVCPHCKSPYWDSLRVFPKREKKDTHS